MQISTTQCQRHKRASMGEAQQPQQRSTGNVNATAAIRDFSHGAPGRAPGSPPRAVAGHTRARGRRRDDASRADQEEKPHDTLHKESVLEHPSPPPKHHPLLALKHSSTIPSPYHSTVFAQFLGPRLCSRYPLCRMPFRRAA